jgi:ABC-2 type transport system ATP-binding protein
MGQPLLKCVDLTVRFGKLWALKGLSISIEPGQLVGLIGPNGAGKTTLLRALCGLQRPHSGDVFVHGEALEKDRDLLRHIGFTPDTPAVYEQLTVRDFLRFIGKGYDLAPDDIEERIDFWLEQLWLTEKAKEKVKTLSRGMRQRIGIVRTMMPNPSVVLLDEPAAGLDPAGRAAFREFLVSLREQGKAIIVSSHILADMDQYCSHIGIMSAGQMVRFDTVEAITNSYMGHRCRYTLRLVGEMAGVEQQLQEIEGLDDIEVEGPRVEFEYSSDPQHASELLARLVALQIPVAAFIPAEVDLEQAYLQSGIRQVD